MLFLWVLYSCMKESKELTSHRILLNGLIELPKILILLRRKFRFIGELLLASLIPRNTRKVYRIYKRLSIL